MCTEVSTPPPHQKYHLSLSGQDPPINVQIVKASLFRQSPLYNIFCEPPLPPVKLGFFCEPPKYESFSSFTQSYFLKVTKFLIKVPQFEFLVITGQNILVYKLSCHYFFMLVYFLSKNCNCQPPLKKSPCLSQQPPSKK